MRILLIGDICGLPGRNMIEEYIPVLKQEYGINFIIANGENIAHGNGITKTYYQFLLDNHIDVVTMGNHTFGNSEILNFINDAKKLIRPLNYPSGVPGVGYVIVNYNQTKIAVLNVMGRTFENSSLDCPFKKTEEILKDLDADIIISDFHGEATSEKTAFGLYFDGKIDIMVGTHTHVQTNDAHFLPKGSLYMTDLGMTGALDGVIGVEPNVIINRFLTGMPVRHTPMLTGRCQLNGLMVDINEKTKKINSYQIINVIK